MLPLVLGLGAVGLGIYAYEKGYLGPHAKTIAADKPAALTSAKGAAVSVKTAANVAAKGAAAAIPLPSPPAGLSPVQNAAFTMNAALGTRGYKKSDMGLYRAFQSAAGLGADGYPGTGTMNALASALTSIPGGIGLAPVKVYPWSSKGGYDGINAPTNAEWSGSASAHGEFGAEGTTVPADPPTVLNTHPASVGVPDHPSSLTSPIATVAPQAGVIGEAPGQGAQLVHTVNDVVRALNSLGYANPPIPTEDMADNYDPIEVGIATQAAILAFQNARGLKVDGIAGPQTKTALQSALAGN